MNQTLIDYYVNLLIIQYHDQPKARATIAAYITASMIYDIAIQVRDGFNLDTAVGAQQDILGKYLGADRIIYGTSFTRQYWGFAEYGATTPFTFNSFTVYGQIPPEVQWYSYRQSNESLFALNDAEYLIILKLKIIQNNAIPSPQLIDNLVQQLFGGSAIFSDRQNMSIGFIFSESIKTLVTIAASEDLLPRSSGVALSLAFTHDIAHIFAYSVYGGTAPNFAVGFAIYGDSSPVGGWAYYG